MIVEKLNLPSWIRADYISHIDEAPVVGNVGKIAALHSVDADITDAQKFERGFSHVPKIWDNGTSEDKKCFVLLSDVFPGTGHSDAQIDAAAQNVAGNISKNACIGDQFTEAGSNPIPWYDGSYFTVGKKFYQKLCEEVGASGAADTNFFCNYDTKLANFCEFFRINGERNPLHPYIVNALASEAGARKKGDETNSNDPYYTSGMSDWTNMFTMMLWANDGETKDWLFNAIFETQRKYAAKADAKTVMYTSPWAQSLNNPVNEHHKNPGHIHKREGGYWKVPDWHTVPFEFQLWVGFFGCLLTEGCYNWDSTVNFSKSIANDRENEWTPDRTWVSEGGTAPGLLPDGEPRYPQFPRAGMDAMVVGVHWYNSIKHIVNASTGVAYATYIADGETVAPQAGDPRLFRRGFRNYGQNTILHLAAAEKGIALETIGAGETLLVYVNPYRLLTEKENITIVSNGKSYDLGKLAGSKLHVFRIKNGAIQ